MSFIFGQQVTEDKIDELIEFVDSRTYFDKEGEIIRCKEIDSLSRLINYNEGIMYSNFVLANNYLNDAPNHALSHALVLDSLITIDAIHLNDTIYVNFHLLKASIYGNLENPILEFDYYSRAENLANEVNNEYIKSSVDHEIAAYYFSKNKFEESLNYSNKILRLYKDLTGDDNIFRYTVTLVDCAICHYELSNYDSTIYYIDNAIEGGYRNYSDMSRAYITLGNTYLKKNDLNEAEKYRLYLGEISKKTSKYTVRQNKNFLFFGDFSLKKQEYKEAIEYYNTALEIADSIGIPKIQEETLLKLINVKLVQLNRSDLSNQLNRLNTIKDSLSNVTALLQENQLFIQFETNRKEKEIEDLKYRDQVNRTARVIIISSAIILLLIAFLIIYQMRYKRKLLAQKLSTVKLEKQIIHSKLNHSIENIKENINTINQLKSELDSNKHSNESITQMIQILDQGYIDEKNWTQVIHHYDQLNSGFTQKVKSNYERITKNDLRLLILVRLDYSNKEIATVRNITESGVKKSKRRLLQKLELSEFSQLNVH